MKKLVSLILVLTLLLLPLQVHGADIGDLIVNETDKTVIVDTGVDPLVAVSLEDGHHPLWIDRIADLPQFARDFYSWLEENACIGGALTDPKLGENSNGSWYHTVAILTETIEVNSTRETYHSDAQKAAVSAMGETFIDATDYLKAVYDAFDRDHPEVFWLSGGDQYSYAGSYDYSYSGGIVSVTYEMPIRFYLKTDSFDIRSSDFPTPEAIQQGMEQIDQTVEWILLDCYATNAYEQVMYLNEVLTRNNAYNSAVAIGYVDSAAPSAWECISALIGSSGVEGPVCEGYARAFMVLCQKLGIPCVLVDGNAKASLYDAPEDHMWNYVQLDGKWYAVDITWNDPYVGWNPFDTRTGYESTKWMLLGGNTEVSSAGMNFLQSHQVVNRVSAGGLGYTNGPLLSDDDYDPNQATAVIQGRVSSYGEDSEPVTLQLYRPGETEPVQELSLCGNQTDFMFSNLQNGSYTLRVSQPGHASREYTVSTEETAPLSLEVYLVGDIRTDGKINIVDVAKIYAHTRGTDKIQDEYLLACADLTGDGKVNIVDTARAYAMIKQ